MLLSRLIKHILTHKSAYKLRPAGEHDADALQNTCWKERDPYSIQQFIRLSLETMYQEQGYVLVAEAEGRAVGFGLLTVWPAAAEISDLIVAAPYRERGIGSAIVNRLTEEARRLGVYRLEIGAANNNCRAYRLYQQLGFVPERVLHLDLGQGLEPVTFLVKYLDRR
ncbi:MAG: GNAT family N-acetyltransferase [Anaerolineae bacterium]|nr:GNAT family N-acetyltransferase [Anaerolineae bacterium]